MAYTAPTAADLKSRFPAFAAVADDTITAALNDAARMVDETWTEADFAPARMLYAAHVMTLDGVGKTTEAQLQGFSKLSIGPLSLERATQDAQPGELKSTSFGRSFIELRRRNRGGPRVTGGC
jgi:hypothetical protein